MIDLSEKLSEQEKGDFKNAVQEVAGNTPKARVGAEKIKRYSLKAGKVVGDGIRDILVDIVSEVVKKTLLQ